MLLQAINLQNKVLLMRNLIQDIEIQLPVDLDFEHELES